ncbi:DOPA 4,5-dioxygenase family protein [Acinetobacter puyangensis]|uniref:DOPA 4,5-dioxygenase family protein n=1 Tax=Acinetobacter puyangensis TaxID=1096779 RepID=UPI003A4D48AC
MVKPASLNYHLHFFFDLEQNADVEMIHQALGQDLPKQVKIFPLLLRPAGPLPKPMFMLEFGQESLDTVLEQLQPYQTQYSIFIHPDLENEYLAHTQYAIWLGQPLKLNLDAL